MPRKNFFRIHKFAIFFVIAAFVLMSAGAAKAAMQEIQPMTFGKWVVTDNSAHYFISVAPDGSYNNSPELIMLEPPQEGIYILDGFTDGVQINDVTVSIGAPLDYGSANFLMDDFQVTYPPTSTDGEITVTLGGRARTNASGRNYGDGVYRGTLTIEIHL